MVWWMQYQVFVPILALQFLQIFWYVLILRIAYRYVRFFVSLFTSAHMILPQRHFRV